MSVAILSEAKPYCWRAVYILRNPHMILLVVREELFDQCEKQKLLNISQEFLQWLLKAFSGIFRKYVISNIYFTVPTMKGYNISVKISQKYQQKYILLEASKLQIISIEHVRPL